MNPFSCGRIWEICRKELSPSKPTLLLIVILNVGFRRKAQ